MALVATPTLVSQRIDAYMRDCFELQLLAEVAPGTDAFVGIDLGDDGQREFSFKVGAGRFVQHRFAFRAARGYNHSRIFLEKRSQGRVVIAHVVLSSRGDCGEGVVHNLLVSGEPCERATDCESGLCNELDPPAPFWTLSRSSQCGASCSQTGSCSSGTACLTHTDCESGICVNGACGCGSADDCATGLSCAHGKCSECSVDDDCLAEEVCAVGRGFLYDGLRCRPAAAEETQPKRADGMLCNEDADCDSGRCGADGPQAKRCGIECSYTQACADPMVACRAVFADAEADGVSDEERESAVEVAAGYIQLPSLLDPPIDFAAGIWFIDHPQVCAATGPGTFTFQAVDPGTSR